MKGKCIKLLTRGNLYTIINAIDKNVDGESTHFVKVAASRGQREMKIISHPTLSGL